MNEQVHVERSRLAILTGFTHYHCRIMQTIHSLLPYINGTALLPCMQYAVIELRIERYDSQLSR